MSAKRSLNRRILIVDDTQNIHDDFRTILAPDNQALTDIHEEEAAIFGDTNLSPTRETFELDGAFQGEEAVTMARTALEEDRPYALAFVDMRMPPGWDGLKTIEKLWEVCPDLETVICSAYSDHDWHSITERLGTTSNLLVLKKPYDTIELLQMAMALTEKWNLKQESEKKYRTIFENSAVSIMLLDERERLLSWNQFTEKMLEMNHNDLHLREAKTLYPEKDWDAISSLHLEKQSNERHFETGMTKKSGDVIDVDMSVSVLQDQNDCVTGFIRVARDITERKRAEEALERSYSLLHATLESTADGMLVIDNTGRIVNFNRSFVTMWELPEETVLHQDIQTIMRAIVDKLVDAPTLSDIQNTHLQSELESQTVLTLKNGQLYEHFSRPQRIANKIMGRVWSFRDITERFRANEILNHKEKSLESIFDAAPFGLLLIDEHINVQRANDSIRDLTGKDYPDIINQPPGIALGCIQVTDCPQSDNFEFRRRKACKECLLSNAIKEAFDTNHSVHKKETHMTLVKDGKAVQPVLSLSVEPVIIDGSRYNVVAIEDVTDRVKSETELRNTMELKSQFMSMVSHELRTPLAAMKEAIAIVHDKLAGPTTKDQNHFLNIATQNIDRLWRLVNDVLDFQKQEACKMTFIMEEEDFVNIVKETYDTMINFSNKRDVSLSLDIDPKIPRCLFDPDRMTQVLVNLMSNAIKFTPAGGQVTIRLRHFDGELILSIIDTGMGISQENLEKIFDNFYRTKRSINTVEGTGLGLPIVKYIIEEHGGRIEVESELDKGTTFTVYLPLNQTATHEILSEQTDRILKNAASAE